MIVKRYDMLALITSVGNIFVDTYDLFLFREGIKGNRKANVIYADGTS